MMLCRLVISVISGRRAPEGKDWMRATADSISSSAWGMLVPDFTSILTDAIPGAAMDLTARTPSSELTCSSTLAMIDSSTSSGVAPG